MTDTMAVGLAVFQLGFSATVSGVLWRLSNWQRKQEGLEARVSGLTGDLVEQRLAAMAERMEACIEDLSGRVEETGDAVRDLGSRQGRLELQVAARIEGVKDELRRGLVPREEMSRFEQGVERRIEQIERRMAC